MTEGRKLDILIAGRHAGSLICGEEGALEFSYADAYNGPDLSVAMPIEGRAFQGRRVHAWFAGLLPDDIDVRRGMASVAGCGPNSVFGLLKAYGMDLPGAVQAIARDSSDEEARESRYVEVAPAGVRERLEAIVKGERIGAAHRWMEPGERWSLGGSQGKIALREFEGRWYSCQGDAASNVIVKPGVSWLESQALDECVCMRLAKRVGLPVADVRLVSFDGFDAIAIGRYDRISWENGEVTRIHQEDFCQALGVVPDKKYAADGGPTSAAVINLAEGDSTGRGRKLFLDALFFNCLVAGTDAHAKNYSLLHTARGAFRMAPLYDVASAVPYMQKGKVYRLAMSVGGENRVGWLRKSSVARLARMHGLDQAALTDRIEELAERVKDGIGPAMEDFSSCAGADELAGLLVPRIRALCNATVRNIRADSARFKPLDVSRIPR